MRILRCSKEAINRGLGIQDYGIIGKYAKLEYGVKG